MQDLFKLMDELQCVFQGRILEDYGNERGGWISRRNKVPAQPHRENQVIEPLFFLPLRNTKVYVDFHQPHILKYKHAL